jgi:hypothetical protein
MEYGSADWKKFEMEVRKLATLAAHHEEKEVKPGPL